LVSGLWLYNYFSPNVAVSGSFTNLCLQVASSSIQYKKSNDSSLDKKKKKKKKQQQQQTNKNSELEGKIKQSIQIAPELPRYSLLSQSPELVICRNFN
jgi:ribosomal protein L9